MFPLLRDDSSSAPTKTNTRRVATYPVRHTRGLFHRIATGEPVLMDHAAGHPGASPTDL